MFQKLQNVPPNNSKMSLTTLNSSISSHSVDLSRSIRRLFTSQTSFSHSNLQIFIIFGLPLISITWYVHFPFFFHAFHVLKPKFWGFLKFLGFFKIDEFFFKFWVGFALKCFQNVIHYISCALEWYLHAFRCVLYVCVLLGLDWAEPMLFFPLHVTCSCIPMHTYLLFNIFDLFELCCDFSDCLSLSLSHSFTWVVSIAPKRKSTPAWNPLRSGASSSSDSAPLNLRFSDGDAHKAFSKNFSRRGVHSER